MRWTFKYVSVSDTHWGVTIPLKNRRNRTISHNFVLLYRQNKFWDFIRSQFSFIRLKPCIYSQTWNGSFISFPLAIFHIKLDSILIPTCNTEQKNSSYAFFLARSISRFSRKSMAGVTSTLLL